MLSHSVMPRADSTVIAACFRARPELEWLERLAADGVALIFVDSRLALVARVEELRPRIVVFPLRDALGLPSAPLIGRLRMHVPDTRVLLLMAPGSSRSGLAEAIRAGGEPAAFECASELRAALSDTGHPDAPSARESEAIADLLAGLQPAVLVESLLFCVLHAHRHLLVDDLATWRGISRRTLTRHARAAAWPTPAELIDWGRLLRASVLQWRESSSLAALAHASGYHDAHALQRAATRLLTRSVSSARDLSPLRVSSDLRRRVAGVMRPLP
jgi:AraC-like DNA-binding protein